MRKITCRVHAEIFVDDRVVKVRTWPACDVMKTSATRGWTTRQFNIALRGAGKDQVVTAEWIACYGKAQGHTRITGWLSGVNGRTMARRGIFEK